MSSNLIVLQPIGTVKSDRTAYEDDHWGEVISTITLMPNIPAEALDGIESFSHLEILFYLHKLNPNLICHGARHPRENPVWPKVGILAQRASNRPNRIGLSVVRLVNREGPMLVVKGLDAVDGTPILDVKPLYREFMPQGEIQQPLWVTELMKEYF